MENKTVPAQIPKTEDAAASSQVEPARHFSMAFAKCVRSFNLYSRNNTALLQALDNAYQLVLLAFERLGAIEFIVRRDKLISMGQQVLDDPDRETGIPFRLFREGVRRLTLEPGLQKAELDRLVEILAKPPSSGDLDEDLVSMLWRSALPNVRYVTLDVFAVGAEGSADEDQAQEEIRQDLDNLLGAIYQGGHQSDDGVKAVNISSDDLVALATLGEDREGETERIGVATQRAIFNVKPEFVSKMLQEIEDDSDEELLNVTFDVLLGVLFRVRTAQESQQVIQEILNLYDTMLLQRDFVSASGLATRLKKFDQGGDLKNVAIIRQLMKLFAAEQRLAQIAVAINDGMVTAVSQLQGLLRALGSDVVPALLTLLATVQQPQHRRLLCDVMLEIQPPSIGLLQQQFGTGEWFVDRDLLYLASNCPEKGAAELIYQGCGHPHARVRQQALGMMQHAPPGQADTNLIKALEDSEAQVRVTAVRTLVARRTEGVGHMLGQMIKQPAFEEREPGEQRTFLMAFGALEGPLAVPVLEQMFEAVSGKGAGGLLGRLRSTMEGVVDGAADSKLDLACSAAVALSSIGTPQARAVLQKGVISKNKKLRDVCERALALRPGQEGGGSS